MSSHTDALLKRCCEHYYQLHKYIIVLIILIFSVTLSKHTDLRNIEKDVLTWSLQKKTNEKRKDDQLSKKKRRRNNFGDIDFDSWSQNLKFSPEKEVNLFGQHLISICVNKQLPVLFLQKIYRFCIVMNLFERVCVYFLEHAIDLVQNKQDQTLIETIPAGKRICSMDGSDRLPSVCLYFVVFSKENASRL